MPMVSAISNCVGCHDTSKVQTKLKIREDFQFGLYRQFLILSVICSFYSTNLGSGYTQEPLWLEFFIYFVTGFIKGTNL